MSEFKITNTVFDKKIESVEVEARDTEESDVEEEKSFEQKIKFIPINKREVSSFCISTDSTNDKSDYF